MYKLTCLVIIAVCVCRIYADDPPIPGYKCPEADVKKGCDAPTACVYQNDKDCATYIRCTSGGLAYLRPCSTGLKWNDHAKICDWPEQTTCH
ncbi:unnamed protein product [Oppiella nova]|uniref:Chitin-binding type-2 domain-containing protein n=1 Tax=Oppiella nova TaxID=334625 RepID=A0A7R9QJM4_9ACAR|nr:unnamed protein product [Oppiella nova]CAG2166323.1 unnamed protein product [Oppiella nova]